MANYYKLSNGSTSVYTCEASLSKSLAAMFSFSSKKVSVEKISMEEYLDYKAQEWMDTHDHIPVQNMKTKLGLSVVCVKFAPGDDDNDDAICHYIVIENGYKRLMVTTQRNLIEGEI